MLPDSQNLLEEYMWTRVDEINNEVHNAAKHLDKKNLDIKIMFFPVLTFALIVFYVIAR